MTSKAIKVKVVKNIIKVSTITTVERNLVVSNRINGSTKNQTVNLQAAVMGVLQSYIIILSLSS